MTFTVGAARASGNAELPGACPLRNLTERTGKTAREPYCVSLVTFKGDWGHCRLRAVVTKRAPGDGLNFRAYAFSDGNVGATVASPSRRNEKENKCTHVTSPWN